MSLLARTGEERRTRPPPLPCDAQQRSSRPDANTRKLLLPFEETATNKERARRARGERTRATQTRLGLTTARPRYRTNEARKTTDEPQQQQNNEQAKEPASHHQRRTEPRRVSTERRRRPVTSAPPRDVHRVGAEALRARRVGERRRGRLAPVLVREDAGLRVRA